MPKLPVKFDDISKTASSLIVDDFPCDKTKHAADFQLKLKQKTNFDGMTVEVHTDVLKDEKGANTTPTKLTFKHPKPFLFTPGFSIDKFELAADSKIVFDCSANKEFHGVDNLKAELKAKLDSNNWAGAVTYTGLADTSIKLEVDKKANQDMTKAMQGLKAEILRSVGPAVVGAKLDAQNTCPDVGVVVEQGDITGSVMARAKFSEFTVYGHHQVSNDLKIAGSVEIGGKKQGQWSVAGTHKIGDITTKFKVAHDMTLSGAFKTDLAKGVMLNGGASYNVNSGATNYGFRMEIE